MVRAYDPVFERAVEKTLAHEGGYVNDPQDPGGETNFGISKRSYPHVNIAALTREDAIEIYRRDWWDRFNYGRITHEKIAAKTFDFSVNMGPTRAHVLLQRAVIESGGDRIVIDGALGPKTFSAVNLHPNPDLLFAKLVLAAVGFYVSLNNTRFLAGWIRRALA